MAKMPITSNNTICIKGKLKYLVVNLSGNGIDMYNFTKTLNLD